MKLHLSRLLDCTARLIVRRSCEPETGLGEIGVLTEVRGVCVCMEREGAPCSCVVVKFRIFSRKGRIKYLMALKAY